MHNYHSMSSKYIIYYKLLGFTIRINCKLTTNLCNIISQCCRKSCSMTFSGKACKNMHHPCNWNIGLPVVGPWTYETKWCGPMMQIQRCGLKSSRKANPNTLKPKTIIKRYTFSKLKHTPKNKILQITLYD